MSGGTERRPIWDTAVDLNFLEDHPNLQADHLRHYYDTVEFNTDFPSNGVNDVTLKILNMNIRSLSANGTEIIAYLGTHSLKFEVKCLRETWVNERRKIINHFPNYNSFHSSRNLRDGGSVLVLVKQELNASESPNMNLNSDVLECTFVEVADIEKKFTVGCCYRPPSIDYFICFTNLLSEILHSTSRSYQDCFICEDFHLDLLKNRK